MEEKSYDSAGIFRSLVEGIQAFMDDIHYTKCVLGVSGGIDSALVLALAIEALGKDNVLPVFLPSCYTTPVSRDVVTGLASAFEIGIPSFPIDDFLQLGNTRFLAATGVALNGVAFENIQSRFRSVILMAYANMFDAVLFSCGNKSERMVGYCTLYGDSCGALAPIGNIFKTDVYRLMEWYNQHICAIPSALFTKEPSAELAFDQKDTDSLPPYKELDAILAFIEEENLFSKPYTQEMLTKRGINIQVLEQVLALCKKSAFKLEQSAPVLRMRSYYKE